MKKYFKRFLKILTIVILCFCISGILNFAIIPPSFGHWANHDRKVLHGKIDTLIIGDSFTMYSIQPSVLDRHLGCVSFNAGSAAQTLDQTYFLLLDYIKTENIKSVYMGLDYYNFLHGCKESYTVGVRNVYKRLHSSKIKIQYLKEFFSIDKIYDWVFPVKLSTDKIIQIPSTLKAKLNRDYLSFKPVPASKYYYDKGYVFTDISGEQFNDSTADMKDISDEQLNQYIKIIELCKENNIEFHAFHTPVTKARLNFIKNYNLFDVKMHEIADNYKFNYFDFNFYKNRDQLSDETDFLDASHLNNRGSNIFMEWFCLVF